MRRQFPALGGGFDLGEFHAAQGVEAVAGVGRLMDAARAVVEAVEGTGIPPALALSASAAVVLPALARRRARRKLTNSCVYLPLDDAARRELADAGTPFFGPGEAPTHTLYARAPAAYRTAPDRLGYFAERSNEAPPPISA